VINSEPSRTRQQLERFSIVAAEGCVLPTEVWADLPIFCEPVLSEDQSKVAGINFWAVEASGDPEGDYAWGEFLGDEAVRYVRDHGAPNFLTAALQWMGAVLHFEDRCPGPLENGFVYRVLRDFPDADDRLFMAVYQQHPEHLH
jgi:hypothetical protein